MTSYTANIDGFEVTCGLGVKAASAADPIEPTAATVEPLVIIHLGGQQIGGLSTADARDLALALVSMATASEIDAAVVRVWSKRGASDDECRDLLEEVRSVRHDD